MVPPGELMCTMTAAALDFSSRSSASTRSWSLRIRPSILTRAIEPDAANAPRPAGVATTATVTMAAITTRAGDDAPERQLAAHPAAIDDHVRIERHREFSQRAVVEGPHGILRATLICRASITSIAMQYEENKALLPSPREWREQSDMRGCSASRLRIDPHPALAHFSHGRRKKKRPRSKPGPDDPNE